MDHTSHAGQKFVPCYAALRACQPPNPKGLHTRRYSMISSWRWSQARPGAVEPAKLEPADLTVATRSRLVVGRFARHLIAQETGTEAFMSRGMQSEAFYREQVAASR
jgi:hypothetical protein